MAIAGDAVDEPADGEDDELVAPEEGDPCDDSLCPDEPAIPRAAGRLGRDPEPADGTRIGEVAPGTDGVGTLGAWIAGACTGTRTGGGLGGVTGAGGGFGAVTGGTVTGGTGTGGTVTVGTVTVGVATDVTVGTVSAGLA